MDILIAFNLDNLAFHQEENNLQRNWLSQKCKDLLNSVTGVLYPSSEPQQDVSSCRLQSPERQNMGKRGEICFFALLLVLICSCGTGASFTEDDELSIEDGFAKRSMCPWNDANGYEPDENEECFEYDSYQDGNVNTIDEVNYNNQDSGTGLENISKRKEDEVAVGLQDDETDRGGIFRASDVQKEGMWLVC